MIHLFNRKELITVFSDQHLYRLKSALEASGIPYQTKAGIPALSAGRYHGTPFINSDASHPTILYVKASDYARAREVLQRVP